jgi:group I intron endonuclease
MINGKSYVGSSVNLSRRFKSYFNVNYLKISYAKTMLINKALVKHGYSNFNLEVLEFCEKLDVLVREQYYIDIIQPEYNILKTAGSVLGIKHKQETILK